MLGKEERRGIGLNLSDHFGFQDFLFINDFNGDTLSVLNIPGELDLSECSFPQSFPKLVLTHSRPWRPRSRCWTPRCCSRSHHLYLFLSSRFVLLRCLKTFSGSLLLAWLPYLRFRNAHLCLQKKNPKTPWIPLKRKFNSRGGGRRREYSNRTTTHQRRRSYRIWSELKSFANSRQRDQKKSEADFDAKKSERERDREKGGSFLIRSEEEGNLKLYL